MPTFRMSSVVDADGWRELAQLAMLDLGPSPQPGERFTRPLQHDWGAFGSWSGQTLFEIQPREKNWERVNFRHDMRYRAPTDDAKSTLPARLVNPQFEVLHAAGAVRWDAAKRRTVAIDESFRVRGSASLVFAGQLAGIQVEEYQRFEAELREPQQPELIGGRGPR
jgi:hypothetical protein